VQRSPLGHSIGRTTSCGRFSGVFFLNVSVHANLFRASAPIIVDRFVGVLTLLILGLLCLAASDALRKLIGAHAGTLLWGAPLVGGLVTLAFVLRNRRGLQLSALQAALRLERFDSLLLAIVRSSLALSCCS
jgi:hypothetical protein